MNIMLADRVISVEYRDKRFADFFARWETERTDSELTVITDEEKIAAERTAEREKPRICFCGKSF